MGLLLVVALVVPVVGLVAAVTWRPAGFDAAAAVRSGAAISALAWLAVLAGAGTDPGEDLVEAGRFAADGTTSAAGLGAALLLAAAVSARRIDAVAGGSALVAATAGLASATGAGHGGDLLAGLVVAAIAAAVPSYLARRWTVPPAVALAGVALVALGIARHHDARSSLRLVVLAGTPWTAALLLISGSALLAWAGARRRRSAGAVFLPVGLAVVAKTAGFLAGHDAADLGPIELDLRQAVGIGLAITALAAAVRWPRRGARRRLLALPAMRPDVVSALTLWAAATLVAVPEPLPGLLLGAAAVLTAVTGLGAAAVAAAPGAVLLAVELGEAGGSASAVLAGVAVATAAALTAAVAPPGRTRPRPLRATPADASSSRVDALGWLPEPRIVTGPAMALVAWLVAAPGTWGWADAAGAGEFSSWHRAVLLAVPVAVLAVGAGMRASQMPVVPGLAELPVPVARDRGRRGFALLVAAVAGLGASLGWLVLSVARAG